MKRDKVIATFTFAVLVAGMLGGCARAATEGNKTPVRRTVSSVPFKKGARSYASITSNTTVSGQLETSDDKLDDGAHYDAWSFTGNAGDTIFIDMASNEFDTYLMLAIETTAGIDLIAEDDDGGDGLNSHIAGVLNTTGAYHIVASSADNMVTGSYAVRLTQKAGAPAKPAVVVNTNYEQMYPGGGDPNERYALLVGLADYPGEDSDLVGPANDVVRMREVLINKFGYRPENIVTLRDAEGSRAGIANAFVRHLGQAGPNGSAFFYYSGHGMQLDSNYAAVGSQDAESDNVDEALYIFSEQGGMSSVLVDDELGWLSEQLKTDRLLIMLDACHTGTGSRARVSDVRAREVPFKDVRPFLVLPTTFYTGKMRAAPSGSAASRSGVEEAAGPAGHVLLAGSTNVQVSWEIGGKGVFTTFFTEALEASDENTTWADLMTGVRENVEEFTTSTQGMERQTPQLEGTRSTARVIDFLGKR